MKKLFTKFTLLFICMLGLAFIIQAPAFAEDPCSALPAGSAAYKAAGCGGGTSDANLPNLIKNILFAIISVAGVVAVIFTIVGGVNYMTSSGDAGKIEKAKKTILYALIGLAVCALSFAIVNFTINNIINAQSSTQQDTQKNTNKNTNKNNNTQKSNQQTK